MKQLLFAIISITFFLPTPEAQALFGRRGPVGRVLFGPGPQILGSRFNPPLSCRQGGTCGQPRQGNSCGPGGCGQPRQGGSCGPGGCGQRQGGSCGPGGCGQQQGGGSCGPGGCGQGAANNGFDNNAPFPNGNGQQGVQGNSGPIIPGNGQTGAQGNGVFDSTTGQPIGGTGIPTGQQGSGSNPAPVGGHNVPSGTAPNPVSSTTTAPPPPGVVTPPRPTIDGTATTFAKWKLDFISEKATKPTDQDILASASTKSADGKYNYTIIKQDCVFKADPNTKIPTTMVLFNSKDSAQKEESRIAIIPGDKVNASEVAAAWTKLKSSSPDVAGGQLRTVTADPDALYSNFAIKELADHPETQIQLKRINKNGQDQYITRYVHKHQSSMTPENRWTLKDSDAPYYCENQNQVAGAAGAVSSPPAATAPAADVKPPAAQPPVAQPKVDAAAKKVETAIAAHAAFKAKCVSCHTPEKDNGDIVFNSDGSLKSGDLAKIQKAVSDQSMPPSPKPALDAATRQAILEWTSSQ